MVKFFAHNSIFMADKVCIKKINKAFFIVCVFILWMVRFLFREETVLFYSFFSKTEKSLKARGTALGAQDKFLIFVSDME